MNVIEFNNVWKKFKKGEKFNSIRDALPNFLRSIFAKKINNGALPNKEFWALQDVSFQIKKGDVLGIIGPNGAGKSTILKLLSRIMAPNKGEVKIHGRLSALIEVTAGFHPELTGRENVYLNGTILGMKKKEIDSKFDAIVEFSGLRKFIDTPVKRYSSGMFSRLGFSVAAHMDPDILLVDEVLSVGDMAFQAKCAQKMRELFKLGATIVLVSHNLSLIQSLCKRTILLSAGKILKEGPTDEVIPYYQDIVFREREAEIRNKVSGQDYKVRVNQETLVNILGASISNGDGKAKEEFKIGEPISIKVDYEAKEKIESPVFSLDILRPDGVLCCSSNTKNDGLLRRNIEGKRSLKIDLGSINLTPGIYLTKLSIWDKDMIHPYAMRGKDVFKIETSRSHKQIYGVFLPEVVWRIDD